MLAYGYGWVLSVLLLGLAFCGGYERRSISGFNLAAS